MIDPDEYVDADQSDNEERDSCIACSRSGGPYDFETCNGCGNAVCRSCAIEDDFGNVACIEGCGW